MRLRPIYIVFMLCVLTLAAINVAMVKWSHRLPREIKLSMIRTAQNPDTMALGDSLMQNHLISDILNSSAAPKGVSFRLVDSALGGTTPQDQAALAYYTLVFHPGIKTIVLSVKDMQLTKDQPTPPFKLNGNHEVEYDEHLPASFIGEVNGWDAWQRMEFEMVRRMPVMLGTQANVWKDVELARRSMSAIGMPPVKSSSYGRVEDFQALEPVSEAAFDGDSQSFLTNPAHFQRAYEWVFQEAQRRGIKVVMVVIPVTEKHRNKFYSRPSWKPYLSAVSGLAEKKGIPVIDANDWLPDTDFSDGVHMSKQGAAIFSSRLGEPLAGLVR